jgi:hypothetical protein
MHKNTHKCTYVHQYMHTSAFSYLFTEEGPLAAGSSAAYKHTHTHIHIHHIYAYIYE